MFLWVFREDFEITRLRGLIKRKDMKNVKLKKEILKTDLIYVRVSSNDQVAGFSLDTQEKICRDFSKRSEHKILQVFREEGESAKTVDRTELQKIMRYCEENRKQVGRIVVYKVDRMSRSTADYLALKAFFLKLGISIASATENLEDTPTDKFLETLLSAVAELDNNSRSKNTIIGMRARATSGLWPSKAPWGYKNYTTEKIKYIYPDAEKAPIVKMIFEQYSTGKYTFRELAKMANKLGQKSRHGMKISKQLIAKITTNPIYYGMVVIPKFEISTIGSHVSIITEELFKQAQNVRNGIVGRKQPRNKDNPLFPLRGIICDGCGKSISGGKATGKMKKQYSYYNCVNYDCPKRKSINKDAFEKDFTDFLLELTPNDFFFDALKEAIKLAHKTELQSVKSSEKKLNAKIGELKSEKDRLLTMRIKGEILNEDFTPANEAYKFKIVELEKEVSCLSVPELEVENVVDSGVEFLKGLPTIWKTIDVKDLRVLRTLLFPENLSYYYPTIKTLKLSPIYNIKSQIGDDKNRFVTLRRIELRFPP